MAVLQTNDIQERDLTAHLRGLVDVCFEEGQYDAGLAALDQLRSPLYRPSPSHIRQLICIALRAPATSQNENPEKDKATDYEAGGGTGRLRAAVVEQKHTSLPSFNDTEAARRLLVLFALTNTPESLFRAFSSYPLDQNSTAVGGRVDGADVENDGEDSDIAKVAQCIGYATNVWEVIRPGFVNWDIIENRVKGKKRTTRVKIKAEESSDTLSTAVIGDEAWAVLNWLVLLFEIDETRVKECGQPCHSPLLLSTIPSTRSTDPRWDTSAVLDVVFCCLSEQYDERKTTGTKLLHQLINLTSTTLFDSQLLANALYNRLSHDNSGDIFGRLLTNISDFPAVSHFKLQLCMKFLNDASGTRGADPGKRAQPRARGSRHQAVIPVATGAKESIVRTYSLPSWSDIIEPLLTAPIAGHLNAAVCMKIKFELLISYSALQSLQGPHERDIAWHACLADGTFNKIVQNVFSGAAAPDGSEQQSIQVLGEALVSMIPSFHTAIC